MAFNAYLVFKTGGKVEIKGESRSVPDSKAKQGVAIEVSDYGFGVTMPVTTSRSDGGGATVGRANFDAFTASKNIDTATPYLFQYCCTGMNIDSIALHLYRQGDETDSGAVKYALIIFQFCVITKVTISGSGEELPKESIEFNYGKCEYVYHETDKSTGKDTNKEHRYGWSTITNKQDSLMKDWTSFEPPPATKA